MTSGTTTDWRGTYSNVPGTSWTVDLIPSKYPETQLTHGEIEDYKTELLVFGVYSESFEVTRSDDQESVHCISNSLNFKDTVLDGALSEILHSTDFTAAIGESGVIRVGGNIKNVGFFGLGKSLQISTRPNWGYSAFHKMGTQIALIVKTRKIKSIMIELERLSKELSVEATSQLISGVLLGAFESTRYKNSPNKSTLSKISLLNFPEGVEQGVQKGYSIARGVELAKYLIESPPNVCYPQHLADAAEMISIKFNSVFELKILEKSDCEALGMGLYLGVANASSMPPKFIHLTYTKGAPKQDIALIGKGITFDSGGYNLKAGGPGIELMKMDMAGAGAVFGAAYILGELEPENIRIHFLVAACENMVSGGGYRPGDILKASNGKSVEIGNTDAEGRLTLADVLLYAQNKCNATSIVDVATLTGSMVVALGPKIGGFFSSSDALAGEIIDAAKRSGERVWRMPLDEEYNGEITDGIADLRNVGRRLGDAIIAALFLKHFVKTDQIEWAHIDMAGPAWTERSDPTGFGTAMLADWAFNKSKSFK